MKANEQYKKSVFINCPFDRQYKRIFNAVIFAVYDCGFLPRSALEVSGTENRLTRVCNIIKESRYSIHDLSRAGASKKTGLARFNMPLELGIFLGAKEYGSRNQKDKSYLVLDRERYRYQRFISDLNGIDPESHDYQPDVAIRKVRDWLNNTPNIDYMMPGGTTINARYNIFMKVLPKIANQANIAVGELTYKDYCFLVSKWLEENA